VGIDDDDFGLGSHSEFDSGYSESDSGSGLASGSESGPVSDSNLDSDWSARLQVGVHFVHATGPEYELALDFGLHFRLEYGFGLGGSEGGHVELWLNVSFPC